MLFPDFLTKEDVLIIHGDLVARYGGLDAVRSHDLLESAIEQPKTMFHGRFLHKTIFDMAAAYLFHIVMNHPFVDGNKRTGAACADVFLYMNNIAVHASSDLFTEVTLETAEGELTKSEIALFLKKSSRPLAG